MSDSLKGAWTRLYHSLIVNKRRVMSEVPQEYQEGVQALLNKDKEKEEQEDS